jgi:hypothetical protein
MLQKYSHSDVLRESRRPMKKSATCLGHVFFCEWSKQHHFNFYVEKDVPPIHRTMAIMSGFFKISRRFFWGGTPINCFFVALCSVHRRIQHKSTSFLVAFDWYGLYIVSCEI